ncbi:hypothetical protein V6R21_06955 [Limibacter armeniacum]|uniref:hypothetical protein n=1 Tax=Limibacter armeniacum TaxID=466084 RepID=UPI002FE5E6A6
MKFNKYIATASVLAALSLGSCAGEAEQDFLVPANSFGYSTKYSFTDLDKIMISIDAEGVDAAVLEQVVRDEDGNILQIKKLGDMTISGGKASIELNLSDAELSSVGDEVETQYTVTRGGSTETYKYSTIAVTSPISFEADEVIQNGKDAFVRFEVGTANATVSNVVVESAVLKYDEDNADVAFSAVAGDFDLANDSVSLNGVDYSLYDTLAYKVIVNGTSTKTVLVPVNKYTFDSKGEDMKYAGQTFTFMEDVETVGFDIVSGTGNDLGITGLGTTMFVKAADLDVSDKFQAQNAYDAGTPAASLAGLVDGDIVVYKSTYTDEDNKEHTVFGTLTVDDVTITLDADGAIEDKSISFSFQN